MTSTLNCSLVAAATITMNCNLLAQPKIPDDYQVGGFAIGCQAYSFRGYTQKAAAGQFKGFSLFEAIERTAASGARVIELYPGQSLSPEEPDVRFSHDSPPEVIARVKAKLAEHGVLAVNYGVVGISAKEAEARKVFEFARTLGIRAVTTESANAIDTIEKLVREFDIAVGFHNHAGSLERPDYKIWHPLYVAGLVEGRDRRIGVAADTGHWCTSGLKPVECLRLLDGRIISVHLKDKEDFGKSHDVPFGEGVADIAACLRELERQGFDGNLSIEYEHNWENNLPEITRCVEFIRQHPRGGAESGAGE